MSLLLWIGIGAYSRDAQLLITMKSWALSKGIIIITNTEIITKATESKMQFILDENRELQEILRDKCRIVEHPIKYKLKNVFEIFVHVDETKNYWFSNYGRCVNNLNHKDKNTFYKYKEGKCHYTVFVIERYPIKNKKDKPIGEIADIMYKRDTTPEDLVVDIFLVKYKGRFKVYTVFLFDEKTIFIEIPI